MNGLYWIITEIEGKVPSLTGLATSAGLTSLKNKLAGFSNLVKKQIMAQKHQTLKVNILLRLIITNSHVNLKQ